MNVKRRLIRLLAVLTVWLAAGCQTVITPVIATPTLTRSAIFTPYHTNSPSPTATRPTTTPPTTTPTPTSTPTPRTHVVKAGEDMSGIALRYRVPLADLKTANPTVNPRLMLVGTILIIPGTAPAVTGEAPATATPQPVLLETPSCTEDAAGGVWCFVQVHNQSQTAMINVTVQFRLLDGAGKTIYQQATSTSLDILPGGGILPAAAFFTPPIPAQYTVSVELDAALPASSVAEHYPQVKIDALQTQLAEDGLSAVANGTANLAENQVDPAQLSMLAVAFAADGSVVGVRRWDTLNPPRAGQPIKFTVQVFSSGKSIQSVKVFAEARK
jgi:LysM repeat protein